MSAPRNAAVDLLRFVGAAAIVYLHLGLPHDGWALAALPLFMALLVYYGTGRPISERAHRLLLPWLAWSAVYGALKVADALSAGQPILSEFRLWMLLTGPVLPLWFLPFAFLFLAVFDAVPARLRRAAALVSSVVVVLALNLLALPAPFNHWASVWAAGAAGHLMRNTGQAPRVALGLAAIFAALALIPPLDSYAKQTALAGLALAMATSVRLPPVALVSALASLSFGVYLSHHGVAAVVTRFTPLTGWPLFCFVLLAACGVTLVLRRVAPRLV